MKEHLTTFDEHLDERYGPIGTIKRANFEIKAKAFAIGEIIREARKEAKMTQEHLPKKREQRKALSPGSRTDEATSNFRLFTD